MLRKTLRKSVHAPLSQGRSAISTPSQSRGRGFQSRVLRVFAMGTSPRAALAGRAALLLTQEGAALRKGLANLDSKQYVPSIDIVITAA